ncbi:malignant fibrous histiocytoma-amplified sequence 1 homolog [Clonorchis sinensis]|uniref:Malignant fibrous histiocytoma-amplified sequence 1 homolog n=1 Tax=Clonorchis sinensis TaxID=79923 RepID=G7YBK4_CLOSI|nr:malignant fibrous histiocytoma-amplified sequence 1 homolog [Clonorchis sinensis]
MNAGCEKTTAFKMAGTSLRLHIETEDREYPSMYKLKLQGKDLENVPAELFTLRELEVLCMSPDRQSSLNYKLCNVPPEIGYLTRLRILLLDTNDLHNLPAEIGSLTRLEKLSVSNNRIRQLPPTIADLKNLHTLHLANNQFSEFPAPILQLENLKFLDMCSNQLRVLPPAIGNLKNLETLLLFDNQLSELPEEFGELTRLRCLWLGDNFLQSLPKSITKLEHLMWTPLLCPTATVDGNPLVNPPAKVCKGGLDEMARHFAQS